MADEKIDLSLQEILARQGANGKGHEDPTKNVKDLVAEVVIRIDALRESERRLLDSEIRRIDSEMKLRADFGEQLASAEAKRIDAIRAVDVNAVAIANERAAAQATVLAQQVQASAETQRALVTATAITQKQQADQTTAQLSDRIEQMVKQLSERISALEKLQYEGKGLSGTIPPSVVEQLAQLQESRYRTEGRSGLSTPIMMMLASLGGGLIIFLVQQFMR